MSPESTHDLSIQDLLRMLNDKLSLEWTRIREASPSRVFSAAELKSELESLETKAWDILGFARASRNALQPVNRLPPEILSRIAGCSLDEYALDTRSIIPLTHVCRYWRQSIISAPENWTLISSYPIQQTELALERSKAAPLHLRICSRFVNRSIFRDLITPYTQKIETLRFEELETIEDLTRTLPNFPQSTPNLRSLGLTHLNDAPPWNPLTDPFELFPNTLRSLSLYEIPLYPSFLRLRTLTKLSLRYHMIHPPLDTLFDLLEENRSLESVDLEMDFNGIAVSIPQRRTVAVDRLQHLSITFRDVVIGQTLISSIPLRRGAHLEIALSGEYTGLGLHNILYDNSTTHLPTLLSPTFMKYRSFPREVRLIGPNGSFSYDRVRYSGIPLTGFAGTPFLEFLVLPRADIRELHLVYHDPSIMFDPSSFPALEALTIECGTNVSRLFFALFPDPSSFPSLKTLRFFNCVITEEFMEELTWFASDRRDTASVWLDRVVIAHWNGNFPTVASIRRLEEHIPIVDLQLTNTSPRFC